MQELKPIKEGKVREIYDNGDSLIMVATDRISCFDVILHNEVTSKGAVLTQMSKFWFDLTKDIVPNHMISVDTKDMPEFFQQKKFEGKTMMCRKLHMLPIECIVRGYITGSGWASYKKDGTVCGIRLPEGLKESDKLPEPIYRERAVNMQSSFATQRSLYIRNVQNMHSPEASSLLIQNSSSVSMTRATS